MRSWNTVVASGLALALTVPTASASFVYVTSYAGTLTTLNLTVPGGPGMNGTLNAIATSTGCAGNTSWLTLDQPNSVLYCLDEGFTTPNGTLVSFKTSKNGTLTPLGKTNTPSGPVAAVVYGDGGKGLAVASYSGSALSSYVIADPAKLAQSQADFFKLSKPGTNPDRQEAPHPHEALLDPTGQFVLVPDLGADLVRVFAVNKSSLALTASTPLTVAAGSGPRHVAFIVTKTGKTLMYLASELANTVTGFEVSYLKDGTLGFKQVYLSGTHGLNATVPAGAAAAEIHASPDGKFIIVSSRKEASFNIANFDPKNSTQIPSDAIINFSVDHETGALTALQVVPSGGMIPRQFSISKAGDLLGIGLQGDGRVVVMARDPASGMLKGFVANANVAGEVTCVVFDE